MMTLEFPARQGVTGMRWDMSEEEIDYIIRTRRIFIQDNLRYDNENSEEWIVIISSLRFETTNAGCLDFSLELSMPWQPPSHIPFVPQNMYEDFVRHRQLYVNKRAGKGIYFTTYKIEAE